MNKIETDHLARQAIVYIRQSTLTQVRHNRESRRRQYGLAERARRLGWNEPVVIDEDLGRSGGGTSRPGFERLLVSICKGRVRIVLSLEASRLARNGRDWHSLLEFCALVGCLLGDEDGVYDPRLPNDRLLLGMKGTLSEMELTTLRQRSLEALRLKASRGELFLGVAVGYVSQRGQRALPRHHAAVHRRGLCRGTAAASAVAQDPVQRGVEPAAPSQPRQHGQRQR